MNEGYIKLYRKFTEWEWYSNTNTKIIFLHFLLSANYKESRYQGYIIPAGSLVCGLESLSKNLGLSISKVRTGISNLKSSGEIAIKTTPKFSIISIINWEEYQADSKQIADNSQTNRKQIATSKEGKKYNIINNIIYKPDGVSDVTWDGFVKMRKEKKAPITEAAMSGISKQAAIAGMTMQDTLQEMVNRNWTGFKASWMTDKDGKKTYSANLLDAGQDAINKIRMEREDGYN